MNGQALKRLQALEARYKTMRGKCCIAVIDEAETGQCIVSETVYHKNGQALQRSYKIAANSPQEAAELYKEPEGCTDSILLIKDYGDPVMTCNEGGKI